MSARGLPATFVVVGILAAISVIGQHPGQVSLAEVTFQSFFGSQGTVGQLLFYALYTLGPGFALQLQLAEGGQRWLLLELLRIGSWHRWINRIIVRAAVGAGLYVLGVHLVMLTTFAVAGGREFEASSIPLEFLTPYVLVVGWLQILFFCELAALIRLFSARRTAALLGLALALMWLGIGSAVLTYNPLTLAETRHLSEGENAFTPALILTAANALLLASTHLCARLRYPKQWRERNLWN